MMEVFSLCLSAMALLGAGFSWLWLSSRSSSTSSRKLSQSVEAAVEDLQSWRRRIQQEWEDVYAKQRSILGRLDRARRKNGSPDVVQEDQEQPQLASGPDFIAQMNRQALRARGINVPE